MNRITSKIQQVNRRGEGAFIPYLMAGDPTPERSMDYIRALADGGADIIELGVPFSDPVADGPTIQAAGVRAMSSTRGPADALDLVRKVGEEVEIPLILMSYYNPILQFGEPEFLIESKKAGVDGLILPDLPVEEGQPFLESARDFSVQTPLLATPETGKKRLSKIEERATGFLYLVARPGTTGMKDELEETTTRAIKFVKSQVSNKLPVCVGFGLSTPDQIAEVIRSGADGAIVGSAIVKKIGNGYEPEEIRKFVAELNEGTKE
ncbi:MAG: tryptophan synthase subunit alpha [Candidatus Bipolaricaulota bacterium]